MARPRLDSIKVPTQTRILAAAERRFAVSGFAETSLADIAEDAGIRRASLLYHFASKEVLYQALVEELFAGLAAALAPSFLQAAPFQDRLMNMTQAFIDYLDERPGFAPLVIRDLMDDRGETRERLFQLLDALVGEVETWVEREGEGLVPPGLDVRGGILLICSDALLRKGSGDLGSRLWGEAHQSLALSRRLFFGA